MPAWKHDRIPVPFSDRRYRCAQELAAFPFVFQEIAVSLRACPEHFFYSVGLVLEEFERHGKAAVDTGESFQRAVEDVHLEFVPRHSDPRGTERYHLNRVAY